MKNFERSLNKNGRRPNSVIVLGAMFGDEGKGRVTDELTEYFLNTKRFKKVIVYRGNGGANAGHTISCNGKKIGLHQIGSGILHKGCIVILGKGMVIHPGDLVEEIEQVKNTFKFDQLPASLYVDEMATLNLDTHRAFEYALNSIHSRSLGASAATGRGIAPAYADVLFRFPLRVRDLYKRGWKNILQEHYERYDNWIKGMDIDMKKMHIQRLNGRDYEIGNCAKFLKDLESSREKLKPYVNNVNSLLIKNWGSTTPFIFEKAQGVGLDYRWGLYPDVSASNCCLDGITYSTQGIVNAQDISGRFGVIKSTYSSSVGKRKLPTGMEERYAKIIREDAHEYGTTTGRPRDIAYLDLVMLKYFCEMSDIEELVFTHMDIIYERPVKLCVGYKMGDKKVEYRPDQEFINGVRPIYKDFKPWRKEDLLKAKSIRSLSKESKEYMQYISEYTKTKSVMITYGPDRHDTLFI